jgi:hypothetical protein
VPILGSLGCPYKCNFCIDSEVEYQPLSFDQVCEDLVFLERQSKPLGVSWYDPNFGVDLEKYMDAIEISIKPGRLKFAAETSLSLLKEPHLKRLKKCGFKAIISGIESWYDFNMKSRTGNRSGVSKLLEVSDHVNLTLNYIPYVQTNFIYGLDSDYDSLPFELTKRFVDIVPRTFPYYQLLTVFGNSTPLNLKYQSQGRIIDIPFHFLDCYSISNVRFKNYTFNQFYEHYIDLLKYSFSPKAIWTRFKANTDPLPRWMTLLRTFSSERISPKYYKVIQKQFENDYSFRAFHTGESATLPWYYVRKIKNGLGPFYHHLPEPVLRYLEGVK